MIDPSFRNALIKQNGEKPVEAQLAILDELISTHRRYCSPAYDLADRRLGGLFRGPVSWLGCAHSNDRVVLPSARRGRPTYHNGRRSSFGDNDSDPGQPYIDRRSVETDP